ncbi:MAG: hypothetical protein E7187_08785 [Erysipelotrichaceae bacterium]|nr:hypothetical protein [Erysipelotrichaceae bacterium]MBR2544723.1 single-stranded DNA-binding protein [Erysipelotrichaceae bacterium]MBR2701439.1 single-stranded DNA-binding protein [Erysipelotrichaceae bacterium]MBR2746121.1 single-stranded DNA-binding protein [Erysipelotrichaceae bacterium]
MINQTIIVGRLKTLPENFTKDPLKYSEIRIEVERSYRDNRGQPLSDIFKVILWRGISDITAEKYPVGSIIAVRGRLESENGEIVIMAERVSFISSNDTDVHTN